MRNLRFWLLVAVSMLLGSCASKEPIRIGLVASLTHFSTELGTQGRDGAILAVEEINAQGGIHGRPLELVIHDVGGGPDSCLHALQEMQKQKIHYFIGPYTSNMAQVAMDAMSSNDVLLITPTISSDILAQRDDPILRLQGSLRNQVQGITRDMIARNLKTAAMVYDVNNREYTQTITKQFRQDFGALGGTIVYIDSIVPNTRPPLTTAENLTSVKAQAIFVVTSGSNMALIAQSLRIKGQTAPLYSASWAMTPELLQQGGAAIEGMTFFSSSPPIESSANGKLFKANFEKHFGKMPAFSAAHSYEAIQAFATGFRLANPENPQSVKDSLLAQNSIHGVYNDFHWDHFGDIVRPQVMVNIQNGTFVSQQMQ